VVAAEQHAPEAVVEEEHAPVGAAEVLRCLAEEEEVVHADVEVPDVEVPEVVEVAVGRVTSEVVRHTSHHHLLIPLLDAAV
jgi:hypothetical protein